MEDTNIQAAHKGFGAARRSGPFLPKWQQMCLGSGWDRLGDRDALMHEGANDKESPLPTRQQRRRPQATWNLRSAHLPGDDRFLDRDPLTSQRNNENCISQSTCHTGLMNLGIGIN